MPNIKIERTPEELSALENLWAPIIGPMSAFSELVPKLSGEVQKEIGDYVLEKIRLLVEDIINDESAPQSLKLVLTMSSMMKAD